MRYLPFALLFCLIISCNEAEPLEKPVVIRSVNVQHVYGQGGRRQRTFSGSARAGQASKLSFRVAGTIQELPVKLGDRVWVGSEGVAATVQPNENNTPYGTLLSLSFFFSFSLNSEEKFYHFRMEKFHAKRGVL